MNRLTFEHVSFLLELLSTPQLGVPIGKAKVASETLDILNALHSELAPPPNTKSPAALARHAKRGANGKGQPPAA